MADENTVAVIGGSGFVGRYITARMAADGWRVRVVSRTPEALPQDRVVPVAANVRDDASIREAVMGAQAVVNLVAVLNSVGEQSFENLHVEAADRVSRLAREEGVSHFVHVSSIGSHPGAASQYAQTKGKGEAAVLQHFEHAMILRPSLIFGAEDGLFNRFAAMAKYGPVLPIFGGNSKFQPVYVDDVAQAACLGIKGKATGVYELGGPDIETLTQLMHRMLGVLGWRRQVINLPFPVGALMGGSLDLLQTITGGLFENGMVTADQIVTLRSDNVVNPGASGFAELKITPTPMSDILPTYLNKHNS